MFMKGTSISYVGTHTFTKGYIKKLKELNDYRINGYLRIIESLNDEINTVSNPGSYHRNYNRVWDIWIRNNKGDNQVVTIYYSLTLRLSLSLIATFSQKYMPTPHLKYHIYNDRYRIGKRG